MAVELKGAKMNERGSVDTGRVLGLMAVQVSNLIALIDAWERDGAIDVSGSDDAPVVAAARELEEAYREGRVSEVVARWDAEDERVLPRHDAASEAS
ncbi:hypothetical protein WMF38_57015 [Sorangium sp. So ce118]